MNKLFYALSALFLLFCSNACAIIVETNDLMVVEKEILQLDDDALVVFDVDYTLLVPNDRLLGPYGEVYRQEFNSKYRGLHNHQWETLMSKVLLQSQVSLVDEKVLDIIELLKQKQIKTIALTAMSTGKLGLIPNAEAWRIKQLDSLGINFDWAFPHLDVISFHAFQGRGSPPVFKQGVLASAKYPKGNVLLAFLKETGYQPSKVIFVDDRIDYIQSVESELARVQIPLVSFHYKAASCQPLHLDKELADFQLAYLLQNGEWLSDEEAKQIYRPVPASMEIDRS